ncbi:hypothetical protein ZWY2020_046952 [Hordeum vulgare]|nr:hypothetical protein ZWY2020_046952 [Hordeum vulgare]
MASSSTSARSRPSGDHLPLIMCPDCGEVQVETNISGVPGPNMGRRFYKCPIDSFSDFKRQLVRDIGFGGVLGIKPLPKLNLKFSSCLMEKVNPDTKEILIDDDRGIKFFPKDVSNVFGIPCGTKKISTYPTELSKACAEFKKIAEEMSDKGVHSLKAAEAILVKHLGTDSPSIDIDMFKITAVIFVVGHMLCPSSKNDYTSVDYWEALSTTAEISEYNWSEFVVEHLLSAVRKLKCDLQTRHSTIHLIGCHLFIQGMRIDDVGYSRCFTNKPVIQQHASSPSGAGLEQNNMFKTPDTTSRQHNPRLVSNAMVRATSRKGPSDFARHLRERYPELVSIYTT